MAHCAAMTSPAPAEQRYRERVARAVAAIVADPMAGHRLEDLARLAHFSPFHFHRVYHCAVGETEDPFTLNCVPAMATGTAPDQTDQVYANPNSPVAVDNGATGGAAIGRSH